MASPEPMRPHDLAVTLEQLRASEPNTASVDALVLHVVDSFLNAANQDLRGISVLLDAGLEDCCWHHVRALWEKMIRLAYIAKEPEKRAKHFRHQAVLAEDKSYKAQKADARFARHQDAQYEAALSLAVAEIRTEGDPEGRNWKLPRVKEMADEVGAGADYGIFYAFFSHYTHANYNAIGIQREHLLQSSDNDRTVITKLANFFAAQVGWTRAKTLGNDVAVYDITLRTVLDPTFYQMMMEHSDEIIAVVESKI